MANKLAVSTGVLAALSRMASHPDPKVQADAVAVRDFVEGLVGAENTLRHYVGEYFILNNQFASGELQGMWQRAEPLAIMTEGYGILANGLTQADGALGSIDALGGE